MGVPLGFWQGWLVHEIIFGLLSGFSVIQSFEKAFLSFYICPSLLPFTPGSNGKGVARAGGWELYWSPPPAATDYDRDVGIMEEDSQIVRRGTGGLLNEAGTASCICTQVRRFGETSPVKGRI